jgi:sensor domain CHASE-containing protein
MLRFRLIFTIFLSVVVLIALLFLISQTFLLQSYERIENEQVVRNLERVDLSLQSQSETLNITLRDWGQWDDTYEFINGRYDEYVDSNLDDASILNLQINLMAFVNASGTVAFSKLIDLEEQIVSPSEDLVLKILNYGTYAGPDSEMSGIVALPQGLMLIAALPITTSSGDSPSGGTIIMGRFIDEGFVADLEELTRISIEVLAPQSGLAADGGRSVRQRSAMGHYSVKPLSQQYIAGYLELKDITGADIGTVRITVPRTITQQGQRTVAVYGAISSGAILLVGITVLVLFESLFLRRLARLSGKVDKISVTNLKDAHINDTRNDELGKLAQTINQLLQEVGNAQAKERSANMLEMEAHQKLSKSLKATEDMNKLMIGRELKMVELKEKIARLEEENAALKSQIR